MIRFLPVLGLLLLTTTAEAGPLYPWSHDGSADRVVERFPIPRGCAEAEPTAGSFAEWLRSLPLAPPGTEVRTRDGARVRATYSPALAVVDIDLLGPQDCADSAIRLYGEYLWSKGRVKNLSLHYLSGDEIPWARWAEGCRPRLDARGRRVERWDCSSTRSDAREDFTAYLANVMRYANSASLARDLRAIEAEELGPGDVITQPNPTGGVGHAAIVLRSVDCDDGSRRHLIANGFLPPQSLHVIGKRGVLGSKAWLRYRDYEQQMRGLGATFALRRFEMRDGPASEGERE